MKYPKHEQGQGLAEYAVVFCIILLVGYAVLMLVAPIIKQIWPDLTSTAIQVESQLSNDSVAQAEPTAIPQLTRKELEDAPLTSHAQYGHPERAMGANAIRQSILSGYCSPVNVYVCPLSLSYVLVCPDGSDPKLEDGLVISLVSRSIVTGYPQANGRWGKAVSSCLGPFPLP